MTTALLGMGGVSAVLALAILGVRAAQRRFSWQPELSRKAVHIVMGLTCLSFPWLFDSVWPVWALAVLAGTTLASLRTVPVLRQRFGRVLGGVERDSWGDLLFPFSVAFVFTLARGNTLFFCVPVLIMTLADALAALIGKRYGLSRYQTDDGWKSVEGSSAFFFTAFLTTHIALLITTDIGRGESLLIATVMGLILMLMEAVSWRGLDNLFVPLVTYVCLARMVNLQQAELISRLAVLTIFITFLALWRRQTRLTPMAAIAAGLVLYVGWAVGDWNWLIAPVVTAVIYWALCRLPRSQARPHAVQSIAAVGGVGLCWLALAEILGTVNTIYSYGVAYGANLGMIALAHFMDSRPAQALPWAVAKSSLLAIVAMALPYVFVWRENASLLPLTIAAVAFVAAAVLLFAITQPNLSNCPSDGNRWMRQALISGAVSTAAFGIISKLEPWSKSFL